MTLGGPAAGIRRRGEEEGRTRRARWGLVVALALAACGAEEPPPPAGGGKPPPLTVAEALSSPTGKNLRVRGAVVVHGDDARICDALAESHPPGCPTGARLLDFHAADLPRGAASARGVRWVASVDLVVTVAGADLRYVRGAPHEPASSPARPSAPTS